MASQRPSASSQDNTQHSRYSYESRDRYILMKSLLRDTNNIENKAINPLEMIEMTKEIVREANILFSNSSIEEKAQNPSENFLDSQLMRASSDIIVHCSQAINTNMNKYDKHELADHIKRYDDFWNFAFPLEAPPVAYLYGTFAPEPLPPRVRVRREQARRQQAAPPKVPKKPDNIATYKEETPDFAEKMYRSLKKICKDGPFSYFHVVLDPTSFSHTVENIYYLSFLARDGRVSVYLDAAAGVPVVKTVSHNKRRRSENNSEKQFIVSLDTERWRDLVEAFNVMEPLVKLE